MRRDQANDRIFSGRGYLSGWEKSPVVVYGAAIWKGAEGKQRIC